MNQEEYFSKMYKLNVEESKARKAHMRNMETIAKKQVSISDRTLKELIKVIKKLT